MRDYGSPPDNQLALPGLDTKGEQRMADAREWVATHPEPWAWYKSYARDECERNRSDGKASPNTCLYTMRGVFHVEVANHFAPYFARIAMEQDPSIRMRVARSEADQYTKAVLR